MSLTTNQRPESITDRSSGARWAWIYSEPMRGDLDDADPGDSEWARPVVHWEIEARDPDAQRAFYGALFNWVIGDGPIMNIAAGLGGPEPGPGGHIRQSDRSGVTLYVQVGDIRATLARAVELGGTHVMDPIDLPNGPTLAAIKDPEGNPLTLVQQ
jgi:uncharacterized protein